MPGGYSAAFEAVKRGLKVILFEKDLLGGTCLNRGCVPTKYLSHVAEKISEFNELQKYGVGIEGISFNPALMQKQNYEIVGKLRDGLCQRLQQEKVIIIHAQAKIISPDCVMADENLYSVNNIIIATGANSKIHLLRELLQPIHYLRWNIYQNVYGLLAEASLQ